jgi:hypothetical protein
LTKMLTEESRQRRLRRSVRRPQTENLILVSSWCKFEALSK